MAAVSPAGPVPIIVTSFIRTPSKPFRPLSISIAGWIVIKTLNGSVI
jgi:hypothetical protein